MSAPKAQHGPVVTIAEAAALLKSKDRILVTAHINPDGDAIGAMMGMGYLLKALGKQVALYNVSGLPDYLNWLDMPSPVLTQFSLLPFRPNLIVALDCGDVWRLGPELEDRLVEFPSLNIDHHLGNPQYGSVGNLVDPSMAATGQIVAALADALAVPLTGGLGQAVYLSLVADTGSFSFGNTTPEVLELAARLMRLGLDPESIRARLDSQWTLGKARLWGRLLQDVRLEDEGRIAVSEVTPDDFAQTGGAKSELEQFAELLRCFKGVRVALLVREDYPGKLKISMRSRGEDDVRSVAAEFGGGGHRNAAGATIDMPREQAVPKLLELLKRALK